MEQGYFHRVQAQTPTRFWINNVTRQEALLAIDAGAVGCTQNPSYVWRMLNHPEEKKYTVDLLDKIIDKEENDNDALILLQKELVSNICKLFLPVFEKSYSRFGYVSIQGDPYKEDIESILKYARLNSGISPNVMLKIPVTKEGLLAIETLTAEGFPINATEVMSVKQALDVCEVYKKVLVKIKKRNSPPVYFSHIAGIFDEYLKNIVNNNSIEISADSLYQAGLTVAKKIYNIIKSKAYPVGFISGGARGLHHFTEMVGSDTSVTINWSGTADVLIKSNTPVVQRFFQPNDDRLIDELMEKLKDYRKAYMVNGIAAEEYEEFGPVVYFRTMFEKAWSDSLDFIGKRRNELKYKEKDNREAMKKGGI